MAEKIGTARVKIGGRKVSYEFRYLTCGNPGHAWQTGAQTNEALQTIAAMRAAEQKQKQP